MQWHFSGLLLVKDHVATTGKGQTVWLLTFSKIKIMINNGILDEEGITTLKQSKDTEENSYLIKIKNVAFVLKVSNKIKNLYNLIVPRRILIFFTIVALIVGFSQVGITALYVEHRLKQDDHKLKILNNINRFFQSF